MFFIMRLRLWCVPFINLKVLGCSILSDLDFPMALSCRLNMAIFDDLPVSVLLALSRVHFLGIVVYNAGSCGRWVALRTVMNQILHLREKVKRKVRVHLFFWRPVNDERDLG